MDESIPSNAGEPLLFANLVPNRSRELEYKPGCETWGVAFSPDGSYFAWSQGHNIVKLIPWPLEGCKINRKNTNRLKLHGIAECQSREKVIDCGQNVWGLAIGAPRSENGSQPPVNPNQCATGSVLATGLTNGEIKLWEVPTARLLFNLKGHQAVVRCFAFISNENFMLVSASRDKTLRVWDLKQNGKLLHVLDDHRQWVYCCAISPDFNKLCSVGGGNSVLLWSTISYTILQKLEGHAGDVVSCEFSPDGALLATASSDTHVIVWDPYTGESLMKLRLLRIWSLASRRPITVAALANGLCCTFSPHGGVLATGTRDGHVKFWTVSRVLPTLQHVCRNALRHVTSTQQVMLLQVPKKMKEFLVYRSF
ncbi:WD repeat and SOCS box-containing protein 2 isoform X2 [Narcine bancroftii]|uniref:WD repeat and SOCS box-containing protein 2 isoform X2 n=1 Tax=Narcine bancroftii TaxID=1343680 RepID=UPI003831507C